MNILFHTIAIEPARWTPQKVSARLIDLLAPIANAGFEQLEIFEPHLDADPIEIQDALLLNQLQPVILSSYLNLIKLNESEFAEKLETLAHRIHIFGFKKVRIFPGPGISPTNSVVIAQFNARLEQLAKRLPQTEVLLETHDGSLADDPQLIVRLIDELGLPNVGLLFQPTIFTQESAMAQFAIQKHRIRHLHLQNRKPDNSFSTLLDGVISWPSFLAELAPEIDATLEFVPADICGIEQFNLEATLTQARTEKNYIKSVAAEPSPRSFQPRRPGVHL